MNKMDMGNEKDFQGRIESFDQSVRSLNARLRAVERRLSIAPPAILEDPFEVTEKRIDGFRSELLHVMEEVRSLRQESEDMKALFLEKEVQDMGAIARVFDEELIQIKERLKRTEGLKNISIGSFKVPIEFSGIMGAFFVFVTGMLIYIQRWDVIRSPYFSFAIASLLAISVICRFYILNRQGV